MNSGESTTIQFRVSGRVQGVGFRMFAHMHATAMGLRGWVRNLPDGSVEAVAFGQPSRLSEFAALLRRGPAGASVERLDETVIERPDELPRSFEVRG